MFNEGKIIKDLIFNKVLPRQANLFLEANISLTKAEVNWIKNTAAFIVQNIIDFTNNKTNNWEFTNRLKLKNKNENMPIVYLSFVNNESIADYSQVSKDIFVYALTKQGHLAYSINELQSAIEHELVHHLDSISRQGAGKGYYSNSSINDYYNSSHEKNAHVKQLISAMENNIMNVVQSTANANPGIPVYNLFNKIIQTSMDLACIYNKELLGFITGCNTNIRKSVYKEVVQYFQEYFKNNYDKISRITPNSNVIKRISNGDELVNHNNYWNNIKKQN